MAGDPEFPELPQPGPSQLEIRFRRLLHRCMARAEQQHASDAPGAAAPWQTDPKFHCYVDSLKDLLYDLESSPADAPGPDVLAAYKQRVAWLSRELRPAEVPAFCRKGVLGDGPAAGAGPRPQQVTPAPHSPAGAAGAGRRLLSEADASPQQQTQAQTQQRVRPGGDIGGGGPQFTVSDGARRQVQTQQRLQDELAEDMLNLTAEMKVGAMAMQNAIRYRGKLLDETETALVDSTANAQSVAAKAKERYRAGRGGFCWTCVMLLVVSAVFAAVMVYIKLTAMVGVTGRRAAPRAPPRAAAAPPRVQWAAA